MKVNFILLAAILGALAVALGAFGAHALEGHYTPKALKIYHTGVEYHFYHVFALLFVAILSRHNPASLLRLSAWFFVAGIVLFSGSLYAYILTGIHQLAMITPMGGVSFIIAWVLLFVSEIKHPSL